MYVGMHCFCIEKLACNGSGKRRPKCDEIRSRIAGISGGVEGTAKGPPIITVSRVKGGKGISSVDLTAESNTTPRIASL